MAGGMGLGAYEKLCEIVLGFDRYLCATHGEFFGEDACHPVLGLKRHKVIHDNLWGTNKFTWIECLLIDSPIMQRLKDIRQVGLAFEVYPCAHHKRFEHSLGVLTLASKTFDACVANSSGDLRTFLPRLYDQPYETCIRQVKQELRLAALLHDTGHSLFSHASEKVYSRLPLLREASAELTEIAGKEKGAGEVISFCLARTTALRRLIERGRHKLIGSTGDEGCVGEVNLDHVSLMIIGRAWHPYLQFLGDIVSSAFDADKLDYLLRDAVAAGLPLRYDLDRYLHAVRLNRSTMADGEERLRTLYDAVGQGKVERRETTDGRGYGHYEAYRLRLPASALNVIEQIVICKMMLFSYLYHHTKVRATEGLFERMLDRVQKAWMEEQGVSELEILCRYLELSDSSLRAQFLQSPDSIVKRDAYRIVNRLVPREVVRINSSMATHGDRTPVNDLMADLQNRHKRDELVQRIERLLAEALIQEDGETFGSTVESALNTAGVWLDVPRPPKFTDIDEVASGAEGDSSVGIRHVFPVDKWTQAYTSYSYNVRVFAFSEHIEMVKRAARLAIGEVTGVRSEEFYEKAERAR